MFGSLRRFVDLHKFLDQFPLGVHSKYTRFWQAHFLVGMDILLKIQQNKTKGSNNVGFAQKEPRGEALPSPLQMVHTHICSVPKGSMEWLPVGAKQVLDIC